MRFKTHFERESYKRKLEQHARKKGDAAGLRVGNKVTRPQKTTMYQKKKTCDWPMKTTNQIAEN